MGVIFVSGVYGVGKSTLCEKISHKLNIPYYSASELISSKNGETYGSNKCVRDKDFNQKVLVEETNKKLELSQSILLAGHFCIFNETKNVDRLPLYFFEQVKIDSIVLLEAKIKRIIKNLSDRDKKVYSEVELENLMIEERNSSKMVSAMCGCEMLVHHMLFTDDDVKEVLDWVIRKI